VVYVNKAHKTLPHKYMFTLKIRYTPATCVNERVFSRFKQAHNNILSKLHIIMMSKLMILDFNGTKKLTNALSLHVLHLFIYLFISYQFTKDIKQKAHVSLYKVLSNKTCKHATT